MSDSDSSSASSASDSPRGGSPEPELAPTEEQEQTTQPAAGDDNQDESTPDENSAATPETEANVPVEEEPDPDAEPLHVTWKGEGNSDPSAIAVDFVMIHGVYGGWENESQAGPGSGSSEWKRLIIFVAHDIGGLLVKDALSAAAADIASWVDITEMSRILVFLGSPHRSVDHFDMEDRLSRFLFGAFDSGIAEIRPSTSAISGFAAAAMEINGLFVESKILLRSRAVSVHHQEGYLSKINKAFDIYSATLGIPMEKRIPEPSDSGYDYSHLTKCLGDLLNTFNTPVPADQLRYERTILTLASPIFPLQSSKRDTGDLENSQQIKSWLKHRGPQMLYLHGTQHVRETAEQLFYVMEEHAAKSASTMVLYFSFDRYDVRFTDQVDHVMFVINHFDECTKGSRKQFLDNFAYLSQASENSWKVVVTSHKPGALSEEFSGPWCINMDLDASEEKLISIANTDSTDDMARLLTARPELHFEPRVIEDQLQYIDKFDPLSKHIIWEQAAVRKDWPHETSIEDLLKSLTLDPNATADDDQNLEQLLAWVLGNSPEPAILRQLLTWLLYAVRPLTIWELATVIYLGSDPDKGHASPDSAAIESLISKIKVWLAGIVVIQHNEVKFWHPRLRNILMASGPDLSKFLSQPSAPELASSWAKGYWALSNPITRSTTCLDTLFPIFASLGLADVIEARDDTDTRRGLLEAASKGQSEVVLALMKKIDVPESTLMDIIVAAAAYGNEDMMLDMLDRIISNNPKPDVAAWSPVLLHRAAWIGFDRFADRILDLGYPPDIEGSWSSIIKASPLSQAARNFHVGQGHAEIAKILAEEGKTDIEVTDEDNKTTLYFGCLWGHHHVVEVLLDMGADPNMGIKPDDTPQSWSPLTVAVDDGYEKCVRLLLDKKANPNLPGPSMWGTALRYAAVKGHLNICQMLVDSGADPNSQFISPPILTQMITDYEASENQLEIFDFLLSNNADANAKDSDGTPVLIHASRSDQCMEFVQRLLDHGADVNLLNSSDQSALYFSALDKKEDVTKLLIEKGAKVNEVSSITITPLYFAVPDSDIVRILVESGADPNIGKNSGFTPLMHAAWFGYDESMELLLDHGAALEEVYDGDDENQRGWTALSCAASHASKETVRILAEHGADFKHVSEKGLPILHMAAQEDVLSVLMEYPSRIDVNQLDGDGKSALHYTNVSMYNVKLLVNAGINLNIQEKTRGDTAISLAAYVGNLERVKYFIKQGANIHLGSSCDGAAIHQACRLGHMDVLKFLVENGANVDHVTNYGSCGTPLQAACLQYATGENRTVDETVDYLLDHGADVNVEGGFVGSALHAAAYAATPKTIKTFLDKGAKIDMKDSMNRMPIHAGAFNGIENLKAILEAGGDITSRDSIGRTALHWAAQPGRVQAVEKIISLLPNKEAIDELDIDGWTPLCWAARGTDCWLSVDHASEPEEQIKTMKLLLENGANRFVQASVDLLGSQKK
ncbi:ankyrin-3 [Trichoderma asperellum]|uniref:Ankyrin-3 n=1 Tax=Trichoderma asperellum TaxID=101201 RepID=A0A6V8QU95_TRIAP|nr:ankyrin-3 [Trichoderma asperellum]